MSDFIFLNAYHILIWSEVEGANLWFIENVIFVQLTYQFLQNVTCQHQLENHKNKALSHLANWVSRNHQNIFLVIIVWWNISLSISAWKIRMQSSISEHIRNIPKKCIKIYQKHTKKYIKIYQKPGSSHSADCGRGNPHHPLYLSSPSQVNFLTSPKSTVKWTKIWATYHPF